MLVKLRSLSIKNKEFLLIEISPVRYNFFNKFTLKSQIFYFPLHQKTAGITFKRKTAIFCTIKLSGVKVYSPILLAEKEL